MKDYRNNELKYYVISCIFVFFWMHFKSSVTMLDMWGVLNPLLASPVFYIFTILFDSLYDSNIKFKIIFWRKGMPSRRVFDDIFAKGNPPWFTSDEAKKAYAQLNEAMPKTNERYEYQAREWYKIYSKYRDKKIEQLDVSAKEYRMFRDINIATINLFVLYLLYCLLCQKVYWAYIVFLLLAFIVTNTSARIRGKKWVYNVIAYDINHQSKAE